MEDENEDLVPMPRGGGVSLRKMNDRVTGQRQPQPQPGAATMSRTNIHPKFAFSPCELLRQLLRLVYCFVPWPIYLRTFCVPSCGTNGKVQSVKVLTHLYSRAVRQPFKNKVVLGSTLAGCSAFHWKLPF